MNPLAEHEQAMNYSFLAKQARERGDDDIAIDNYLRAAEIEGKVADYFFDKPDLEPTRSSLIRSAAFLFLKGGDIERAKKYVFWGAAHADDELLKEQFLEALEICVAYQKLDPKEVSKNVDYIYRLRQKSQAYIIEPSQPEFGNAITLEMLSDFSSNFLKSLKAYSKSKYKDWSGEIHPSNEEREIAAESFQRQIKPLITNAGFGSFKFSIATDFLQRFGEEPEFVRLKSNILIKYQKDVFSKQLIDEEIAEIKQQYNEDEIEQIFRPIFNIRSPKSPYKVAYYDKENFTRIFLSRTKNNQKVKLLPIPKKIDPADIGFLESTITHTRATSQGSLIRNTIIRQQLKALSYDIKTDYIEPRIRTPFNLNEEIIITMSFDSEKGFTFSYDDFPLVEGISDNFVEGEKNFFDSFVLYARHIINLKEINEIEEAHQRTIRRLINNPELI